MFKRLSRSKCVSLSYLIYLKTVHSNRNWFDFTLFSQTFYANAIFYLHIPIVASLNLNKTVLYFSRTLLFVLLLLLKCQSASHLQVKSVCLFILVPIYSFKTKLRGYQLFVRELICLYICRYLSYFKISKLYYNLFIAT